MMSQKLSDILKRQALKQRIECIVQVKFPKAQLGIYGSSGLLLFDPFTSDLDLCVMFREPLQREDQAKILCSIGESLKEAKFCHKKDIKFIDARVPLLKLDGESLGVKVDMSCNYYGILKKALIRTYMQQNKGLIFLVLAIVEWSRSTHIVDSGSGITSFGFLWMIFHFLLEIGAISPLDPSSCSIDFTNLYSDDYSLLSKLLESSQDAVHAFGGGELPIGHLFCDFFRFYAEKHQLELCIPDPIEQNQNCVSLKEKEWEEIRQIFEKNHHTVYLCPHLEDFLKLVTSDNIFDQTFCLWNRNFSDIALADFDLDHLIKDSGVELVFFAFLKINVERIY